MPRISAGLLMYRIQEGKLQVLLAHPGGPLFKNKDDGDWTIPKSEIESDEDLLEAAKREFEEEMRRSLFRDGNLCGPLSLRGSYRKTEATSPRRRIP